MLRRDAVCQNNNNNNNFQINSRISFWERERVVCTHGKLCLYIFHMLTIFVLLSLLLLTMDSSFLLCYQRALSHIRGKGVCMRGKFFFCLHCMQKKKVFCIIFFIDASIRLTQKKRELKFKAVEEKQTNECWA